MTTIYWFDRPLAHPRDLLSILDLERAIRHLGVEIGARAARQHAYRLVRRVRRIAAQAAIRGEEIHCYGRGQTSAPAGWDKMSGLGLELRAVRGHLITWDIAIYSYHRRRYYWRLTGESVYRYASNAAHLVREIVRHQARHAEERRQQRIATYSVGARWLADTMRPILGEADEARGWLARDAATLELSHDYYFRAPDWREKLTAAGWRAQSRVFGVDSSIETIERMS